MSIRVFLVDDHELVRRGLADLIGIEGNVNAVILSGFILVFLMIFKPSFEVRPPPQMFQLVDWPLLSRIKAWTCSIVQNDDLPILIGFGNSPFWTMSQNLDFEIGMTSRIWGILIKVTSEFELLMTTSLTGALHIFSINLQSHLCRTHFCVSIRAIQAV